MKLTEELIKSIARSVVDGFSNSDAAALNDVSRQSFYVWIAKAEDTADKPLSKLTPHQKLCRQFKDTLDKAKLQRKKKWIEKLEACNSPTGIIFLLKQTYPAKFNTQPIPIPNFSKLEEFMRSEYTQLEIEAIREAVFAAESRRQSEVVYEEDTLFLEE